MRRTEGGTRNGASNGEQANAAWHSTLAHGKWPDGRVYGFSEFAYDEEHEVYFNVRRMRPRSGISGSPERAQRPWWRRWLGDEGFTCAVEVEQYRSACEGLDFYGEHKGERYCVLHFPGEEKNKEEFLKVKKTKLDRKDYDFGGAIFPEGTSNFERREFDANASFAGVTFVGANFSFAQFSGKQANFTSAQFSGERTDFSEAQFCGEQANFTGAQFCGAETTFKGARFSSAYTAFRDAVLTNNVDFSVTTFKKKVEFWETKIGRHAWVWFGSHIEKPELLTFHGVSLHPGCFINADVRKVDFTEVKWYGMPDGRKGTLDEEIKSLNDRRKGPPYTLLAQACRRLSANAEENREYPLANEFHYWSMDALRKESWHYWLRVAKRCGLPTTLRLVWGRISRRHRSRPRSFGLIATFYWALNGYGVRAARAFWILCSIWLTFAVLYFLSAKSSPFCVFSASDILQGIDYARQAAVYSLSALVRLNPRPQSDALTWFQTLVTIEGILQRRSK